MYTPSRFTDQAPDSISTWAVSLVRWVLGELDELSRDRNAAQDYVLLKTFHAQPQRVQEGMIVKADGTDWNPGGGAGVYAYIAGAWAKLN